MGLEGSDTPSTPPYQSKQFVRNTPRCSVTLSSPQESTIEKPNLSILDRIPGKRLEYVRLGFHPPKSTLDVPYFDNTIMATEPNLIMEVIVGNTNLELS